MFYYYGAKSAFAKRYPYPRLDVIVEPFAGSAGYAMHHVGRNVDRAVLIEANPRVVELWRRLLAMTPEEVLALPLPAVGERTEDLFFMLAMAGNGVLESSGVTVTDRMQLTMDSSKRRVAKILPRIAGRVEVIEGDYTQAPDIEATWFVDPPYQRKADGKRAGDGYGEFSQDRLDFPALGEWCQARRGQVIVCEAGEADWLPFKPLYALSDTAKVHRSSEVMWTNEPASLF